MLLRPIGPECENDFASSPHALNSPAIPVPAMAATQPPNPARFAAACGRVVRLLDALARGASPPGMIDMTPPPRLERGAETNAQLRRRFTMIATFDRHPRTAGRWPASGVLVSLALAAVALSGAVRAQEDPTKAAPAPGPSTPEVRGAKASQPKRPVTRAQAEKLWAEKYTDQVIVVNGREVNREQLDRQYKDELAALGGVEDPATARNRPEAAPDGAETDEERQMAALLGRKIPELNFDAVALADVVDFLRDASGANLFVDWGALEGAGIDRATPVTMRVRNVPLSQALDMALSSAGKGAVPLRYAADGGVVRISTADQLDQLTETRAYDVRDLVPAEIEMKDLAAMIKESVGPDTWRTNGGSVGSLNTSKHKLIVTTTAPNHRQLREVLKMLRDEPRHAKTDEAATAAQGPAGPRQ